MRDSSRVQERRGEGGVQNVKNANTSKERGVMEFNMKVLLKSHHLHAIALGYSLLLPYCVCIF